MNTYDQEVAQVRAELQSLAAELRYPYTSTDRVSAIQGEIDSKAAHLDRLTARKANAYKASAILAGVGNYGGAPSEEPFLKSFVDWKRHGNREAEEAVKAVLGTSAATGQAIVPNNWVANIVEWAAGENVYRNIIPFTNVGALAGVDIPYDRDEITAALQQGAYGSNKDVRDFGFGEATATMYTIAQIADISNQLLRQSGGAAEAHAKRRLGKSLGIAEAKYITAGTGSGQPTGIFQAITDYFAGAFSTALNSEPRAATIGRAIGVLESRGRRARAIVMGPTDYWELAVEGLGTSYGGGWAVDPTGGPQGDPASTLWGVPVHRDPHWPSAQSGVALVMDTSSMEVFTDGEYRLDVSSEAGSRYDQNLTGFRLETQFAANFTGAWRTGAIQKVTGL